MAAENTTIMDQSPPRRARHKWFPAAVLILAGAWWMRQALEAKYQTFNHFLVAMACLALVALWYLRCGGGSSRFRQRLIGGILLGFVVFIALCRPVFNGDMGIVGWRFRFAGDADERLRPLQSAGVANDWETGPHDYPRFLGNGYWAEVAGVELETDWQRHPPQELWRREIGAGWSSFAVVGNYAVTQEQRGEQELVTCYNVETGEPVWVHADETRFDPADVAGSLGDVGPRATPTILGERIFTQGGTGVVNCLEARTGKVLWSHDTATEFGAAVTLWGKSGSPLIVDDMVVISVGGPADAAVTNAKNEVPDPNYHHSLMAFDIETGKVRWAAGSRNAAYATPVLATLAGERQIIVVNEGFVTSHRAADGVVLWEYPWSNADDHSASCSQPVPLPEDRLFLSKGYGVGCSLLSIGRNADGHLEAKPKWRPPIKRVMKTKFSNIVVRGDVAYGLDDVLLECIEWETGQVKWKARRSPEFGHGQIILVGDVILVLSEFGELALVEATPERYHELASMQVLSDANVTWNNPVFSPPYLLVRNAREAACYKLPLKQ